MMRPTSTSAMSPLAVRLLARPFAFALLTTISITTAHAQISQDQYIEGQITVPSEVMDAVAELLPESSNAGAAFISDKYSPNLVVSADATIEVIFLWEGAGYRNSFGYFTWEQDVSGDVEVSSSNLVFPNASFPGAGLMQIGHVSTLRDAAGSPRVFQAGDQIGFFVAANGWSSSAIKQFNPESTTIPSADPATNSSVAQGVYTSIDSVNPENQASQPELTRHTAMIRISGIPGFLNGEDFFIVGFEDLNRVSGSDDDFNDFVAIVRASPVEAVEFSDVFSYSPGDPDEDGVEGSSDHYPTDPTRAVVQSTPDFGFNVIGFEDNYPYLGDGDYNDAVVSYRYDLVYDSEGRLTDLLGTYHLLARGAGYDHVFGVHIPSLPSDASGTVEIERFLSDDAETHEVVTPYSVESLVTNDQRRFVVFPSTKKALPPKDTGNWINTSVNHIQRPAASSRVHIHFSPAINASSLGPIPYDVWYGVRHGSDLYDIHAVGSSGFSDRPDHLPTEEGPTSFVDDNGYPWVLEVPNDWRFPKEKMLIDDAYSNFTQWRESHGVQSSNWYDSFVGSKTAHPAPDYLSIRSWGVALPLP